MDLATLLRGKPGRIMLAGAAFLLLVAIPYLFAHLRQGRRAANRGESTVKVERKNFGQVIRLNGTTQASRSFVVLAPKLEGAQDHEKRCLPHRIRSAGADKGLSG